MKKTFFVLLFGWCILATAMSAPKNYPTGSVQAQAFGLLHQWVDTLLTYQIRSANPALDGGLLCPACARVHGRCGDAVLPILHVADQTGDPRYVEAAKRLMHWMDNVHMPDGSWMNDVHVSDWNGTTVFAAIALIEAVRHHGHLLDDSTRTTWKQQLLQAGEFIYGNKFIYSRRREGMRNMNVNYSASATYALYAIGQMCGRDEFCTRARETAADLVPYFTRQDHFLFGEGPNIWTETPNGCRPVDLLYNVEESLPNLVYYALEANDDALLAHLQTALDTHLQFMLPDGAWDNSWGTRSFKWTYWGGRTSDGFMGGYYALADQNPAYEEAIRRNVRLLSENTHGGLLHGGPHYHAWGVPPCIHHTFGHAKALASFLNQPCRTLPQTTLPRDAQYGVRHFADIRTWLVAEGPWRATLTGYDAEYKVKGTHPMGGVLSMLWMEGRGPVFAATMNLYTLIEAPNMQTYAGEAFRMAGTPRLEVEEGGVMYSNLDDLHTAIAYRRQADTHLFEVFTHLVDSRQQPSSLGTDSVRLTYRLSPGGVDIKAQLPPSMLGKDVRLVLPVIASPQEQEQIATRSLRLDGLLLTSATDLEVAPCRRNRIFNPVPGFTFVPLRVRPDAQGRISVRLAATR